MHAAVREPYKNKFKKLKIKKKSLQIFKLYFVIGLRGSTWEVHVHVTEYVLKVLILLFCDQKYL
jgi:hypothetical protein